MAPIKKGIPMIDALFIIGGWIFVAYFIGRKKDEYYDPLDYWEEDSNFK